MKKTRMPTMWLVSLGPLLLWPQVSHAFYNPANGRWLNRDPIQESGGPNTYAFGDNCPISSIDALGLMRDDSLGFNSEACCNGTWYNFKTHCCCRGKVVAKAPVDTGIRTWKWVSSVGNPSNPGGASDMHVWLTWDSQDGGAGSVDANAVIGTGFVSSPAAGITLDQIPPPTPTAVTLSKCDYDFTCLKRCLDKKAKYWAGQGRYPGGNCQDFVNMLLSTCKADCKGCTSD